MSADDYTSPTDRVQVRLDATTLHIVFNNPVRHNALSVGHNNNSHPAGRSQRISCRYNVNFWRNIVRVTSPQPANPRAHRAGADTRSRYR